MPASPQLTGQSHSLSSSLASPEAAVSAADEASAADSGSKQNQHLQEAQQEEDDDTASVVALHHAPRPPWLRPGAGIEDAAVWCMKKCQQLLGQMLLRAPGAKFPPIFKDLALMQVCGGNLAGRGLCFSVTCGLV